MPGLDALVFEPLVVGFDECGLRVERFVGSADEVVQGEVGFWAGGVEDAGDFVGGAVEEEGGQIARVDEAHQPSGWFGDHE